MKLEINKIITLGNDEEYLIVDKVIKDDDSIIIMESNKPNYFYIKEYRPSGYYKLIRRSYYNGEIIYNDNKAKSILELIIEILE